MLMQGTCLVTIQEQECKLYVEIRNVYFTRKEYRYISTTLRFNLLHQMNVHLQVAIGIASKFQVNTKFLNTLPDEWSKFVTDVKLVKVHCILPLLIASVLPTTTDAYANASSFDAMNVLSDPLALVASHKLPLSTNRSDALTEVHNPDNLAYDLINQSEQIMTSSEQSNDVNQIETEINHTNKALTTELDRYKEEVKDLKEMQNVENSFLGSSEQYAKIKIKQLDNIIFKRGQSAQTVHMMTKSKICYDHSTKQAIGFEKPFYLKKVRESKPKLYDGNVILKMDTIVILDSDETLMRCEESRSKMFLKEQDPLVVKHNVNTKPINYAILNNDYNKQFVRQSDLYSEHAYWKATSVPALTITTNNLFDNLIYIVNMPIGKRLRSQL
ncbi:hypothetical protein Tco_0920049 [Tanacetum coccineum]